MILGKCPYCGGSVISPKLTIRGQKATFKLQTRQKERDINDDYVFK